MPYSTPLSGSNRQFLTFVLVPEGIVHLPCIDDREKEKEKEKEKRSGKILYQWEGIGITIIMLSILLQRNIYLLDELVAHAISKHLIIAKEVEPGFAKARLKSGV